MSGRTFRLVYYSNLIFWGLLAAFLILFVILELVKDGTDPPMAISPTVAESLQVIAPDMKDILLWGYQGRGVKVNVTGLFPGHLDEYEDGYLKYNLNKYLSDRISMRRPLPDVRDQGCRPVNYDLRELPSVSVVVVFRNEPRTTLLRMLYSVIDRSPLELVTEIILVDDGTDVEDLQYPRLEHYLSGLKQVSIVRLPFHLGPGLARMHGVKQATGVVVIFLQPRCECTDGWMLPLLHVVAADSSTIAVPLVDAIDHDTFQYTPVALSDMTVGSFTWDLLTRKRALSEPPEYAMNIQSPVIADGMFAVARDNLRALGGFDGDLILDDSVNIEFSFRSWLCGSRIVQVPCSRVGYIKARSPHQQTGVVNTERIKDSLRVAGRWMGTYRYFVYERMPPLKEELLSQTSQRVSKGNTSCQSFDWFLHKLEPAMAFTEAIQRRGQIHLAGTRGGLLSLVVADGDILLQSGASGPATIWYHLESGALVTENKACLSLAQRANATEQFLEAVPDPLDTNLLELPGFVYRQHVDSQIPEAPAERQTQEQSISRTLRGILFQGERKRFPHAVKRKQSVHQNTSRYSDRKSSPRYDRQSRVGVGKSRHGEDNMFHDTRVRSRSLLNSVPRDSGASGSLSRALVSHNYLHNRSEVDSLGLKLQSEAFAVDALVMKPCVREADGDRWSYTGDHMLRHQTSGHCLEAHRDTSGNHLLRLARCVSGSQVQQWSFISSLLTY